MSDAPHEPMTELDARNAKLEERFVASRLYDPTLERKIKPNAHVVLIPTQDPELEAHNRAYAKQLQSKGDHVQLISEADLMGEAEIAKRQQASRNAYLETLSGLKERLEEEQQG
mgnify:CR=1 FL=1